MLDVLLSIIAPLDCVGCEAEGKLLCAECSKICIDKKDECFFCGIALISTELCLNCSSKQQFDSLSSVGWYKGMLKDAVYSYKFGHKRGAAHTIASLLTAHPDVSNAVVLYIPTSALHRRERGFDHAALLARSYAYKHALPLSAALKRTNNRRQLGGNKSARKRLVAQTFTIAAGNDLSDKTVLLIDDVITTGATLNEAARVLKQAGVRAVHAVVVAKTPINH